MPTRMETRGWMRARTLCLFLAVILYWASCVNWDVYLYGTAFVFLPWAVLLVARALARGREGGRAGAPRPSVAAATTTARTDVGGRG